MDELEPVETCTCCGRRGVRAVVRSDAEEPEDVAVCPECDERPTALPGWTVDFAEDLDPPG